MTFTTNWDIEKYKTEHETDDQWNLKRKFLEAHKTDYPENKLICLAQVFLNMEFMGCSYPKQTMELVDVMSRSIAADYRKKRATEPKRTFVEASKAAEDKAKRTRTA